MKRRNPVSGFVESDRHLAKGRLLSSPIRHGTNWRRSSRTVIYSTADIKYTSSTFERYDFASQHGATADITIAVGVFDHALDRRRARMVCPRFHPKSGNPVMPKEKDNKHTNSERCNCRTQYPKFNSAIELNPARRGCWRSLHGYSLIRVVFLRRGHNLATELGKIATPAGRASSLHASPT